MKVIRLCASLALVGGSLSVLQSLGQDIATEHVDLGMLAAVRSEDLNHSQVMDHAGSIADMFGPRVTSSENLDKAAQWAESQMKGLGLVNVYEEHFSFGKGWSLDHFDASMVRPTYQPLIGFPKSFMPGTKGRVTAEVQRVQVDSEADFAKYHGKLEGKIIVRHRVREVRMLEGTIVQRWTPDLFKEAESTPTVDPAGASAAGAAKVAAAFNAKAEAFFVQEKVVADLDRAYYNLDNGTGRLRGVWIQRKFAVEPIFHSCYESLRDLGLTAIAPRSVAGSDYSQFDEVGLPGFQFMRDWLELKFARAPLQHGYSGPPSTG